MASSDTWMTDLDTLRELAAYGWEMGVFMDKAKTIIDFFNKPEEWVDLYEEWEIAMRADHSSDLHTSARAGG